MTKTGTIPTNHTAQSEVGALVRVLVTHAADAFRDQATLNREWRRFGYTACPDFAAACRESDTFIERLSEVGAEVLRVQADVAIGIDALYPRDAGIVADEGLIKCRMGKPERQKEPDVLAAAYETSGLKVIGEVRPPGTVEGGDVVWIDEQTLLVGRSYRTNASGIRQLRQMLEGAGIVVLEYPLPHWRGPKDVFHLMSILSPLDRRLALVYLPLLPVTLREFLEEKEIALVEVPDAEFDTMGCNVLALGPSRALMLEGNSETRRRMEKAGVEVRTYKGHEISLKGQGGPTCLTRPFLRRHP